MATIKLRRARTRVRTNGFLMIEMLFYIQVVSIVN
jgi:hypothetical protein